MTRLIFVFALVLLPLVFAEGFNKTISTEDSIEFDHLSEVENVLESTDKKRYDHFQVVRMWPSNESEVKVLNDLDTDGDVSLVSDLMCYNCH